MWFRKHFSRVFVWLAYYVVYIAMYIIASIVSLVYSTVSDYGKLIELIAWWGSNIVATLLIFLILKYVCSFIMNVSNKIYRSRRGVRFRIVGIVAIVLASIGILAGIIGANDIFLDDVFMLIFGIRMTYLGFTMKRNEEEYDVQNAGEEDNEQSLENNRYTPKRDQTTKESETTFLMQAASGRMVSVPASELEAWQRGQEKLKNGDPEAKRQVAEQSKRLTDEIRKARESGKTPEQFLEEFRTLLQSQQQK